MATQVHLVRKPTKGWFAVDFQNLNTKFLIWTPKGYDAFERLKALVNNCPKLYFVDNYTYLSSFTSTLLNIRAGCTSDQLLRTLPDRGSIEEP